MNQQFEELAKTTLQEEQLINNNNNSNNKLTIEDKSAKSPDFFQDDKSVKKEKLGKKYTTTRVKSRSFLSDISYMGTNKEDFYNENFVFDIYTLITKNLNLFSLDRKLSDQKKHEMIYMLWKECMPASFYKHICSQENFLYLNGKNVLYPKVSEIINDFLDVDKKNYVQLRNNLSQFKNIFPHVYSNVYAEIYCSTERRGFDLKSIFQIVFKASKDKEKAEHLGKHPQNYVPKHAVMSKFEQKSIKTDSFNKEEEKGVKELVEKSKIKRREVTEKNKLLKKKEKLKTARNLKKKCGID